MVRRGVLTSLAPGKVLGPPRLLTPRDRGLGDVVACSWLRPARSPGQESRPDRGLRLIALFKFAKMALLMAVGLGALQLLDPKITARAQRWTSAVATSSDRRVLQHLLAHILGLSPGRLEVLALGAFLYSALFATEGVGLWLGRRWAEYLTVVATASFVPLELFEVLQRASVLRVGALVLNVAAAAYLIYRLRQPQTGKPRPVDSPG
ncbi:MAG: DUF2127 domain-containing protein [Gemmatimonadales bacterium]